MSRATFLVGCAALCLACQAKDPVQPITPGPQNLPPQARLAINQTFVEGIEFPAFDTRGTADPEGEPLRFWWDFGDGSTSTDDRPAHAFIDNGTYLVTLIVTDPHNAADTATALMSITNLPPHINSVSLSVPPVPSAVPTRAVMHVDFFDYGATDNPHLTINWGDGTISQDTIHSYTVPGTYPIDVTVSDKDGATETTNLGLPIWVYDPSQVPPTAPGYEAIDLGTLGGRRAVPSSVNNHGEVVGYSMTADSQYHAFLWKDGFMKDIGLPLIGSTVAQIINDAGWIVGASSYEGENSLAIWRNGTLTTYRTGGEDNNAQAVAVDDAGDVLVNISGHEYGSSAIWRNGALIRLGGLQANGFATAFDINTRGQIVGSSAFIYAGAASYAYHAFLWEGGVMRDLGDLGYGCDEANPYDRCNYSAAVSINEHGQIVGVATAPSGIVRAAIWDSGGRPAKDLGFGTGSSRAVAINDRGQIVGDNDQGEAFFRDTDGVITSVGSLGGGVTHVTAMNEAGIVVGWSKTGAGDTHPFVWRRESGMVDLGAGPFGARGVGAVPVAINERGDVVGYAVPCANAQSGECYPYWGTILRATLWRAKTPASVATVRR